MKATDYATKLTEAQLQERVVTLANARGWLVHHDRRQDLGVGGDAGFPDLVLARAGVVVFVELKTMSGRISTRQRSWLDALAAFSEPGCAASHHVRVWRPSDWPEIESVLNAAPGMEPL